MKPVEQKDLVEFGSDNLDLIDTGLVIAQQQHPSSVLKVLLGGSKKGLLSHLHIYFDPPPTFSIGSSINKQEINVWWG